jgi:hypothetical protein
MVLATKIKSHGIKLAQAVMLWTRVLKTSSAIRNRAQLSCLSARIAASCFRIRATCQIALQRTPEAILLSTNRTQTFIDTDSGGANALTMSRVLRRCVKRPVLDSNWGRRTRFLLSKGDVLGIMPRPLSQELLVGTDIAQLQARECPQVSSMETADINTQTPHITIHFSGFALTHFNLSDGSRIGRTPSKVKVPMRLSCPTPYTPSLICSIGQTVHSDLDPLMLNSKALNRGAHADVAAPNRMKRKRFNQILD